MSFFYPVIFALAAMMMSTVWAAYLRKTNIYRPEKWIWIVLAVAVGGLTVIPPLTINLPEFYFTAEKNAFPDRAMFYIWNIGFMEEISKLSGFLLLWIVFRRKLFTEPPNYILLGSMVALGFATVENYIYFEQYGVQIVYLRGMMSTFSHMAGTAIVVSFFYFGQKRGWAWCILYTMGGLLVSSLEHGLFDTFFSYKQGWWKIAGVLMGLLLYLVSIEVYSRLLNNFLNLSTRFEPQKCLDRRLIQRFLLISFFMAGAVQLAGLMGRYGFTGGILANMGMLLQEVLFTVILITRISRFTFRQGKWAPVYPLLPVTYRNIPRYDPQKHTWHYVTQLAIRGDEFNEYPYTKNLFKLVRLHPLYPERSNLGSSFYATMLEKVYLGKKEEIYYRMEVLDAELDFENHHPVQFLLKPKVRGVQHIKNEPIAGFMLLPVTGYQPGMEPGELQYLEWVMLESTGGTKKPRPGLLAQIFS